MTSRLALSILLIVWATLIAGGTVAYLTTRTVLLADLDAALISRARSLPELSGHAESSPSLEEAAGDRYVISNHLGKTFGRLAESQSPAPQPAVISSGNITLGDGTPGRRLTLRFTPRQGGEPMTVVYTGSAVRVYRVLARLALALAVFGIAAGIAAAGVAILVSRHALRPLRTTAAVIGEIDERKLDRRIDAAALPPEMRPVADRLNDMLERLAQSFSQRKQFLADASHELRTPVAALAMTLEVALRRPRDAAELTRVLRTCLSDARMLKQLVQSLMEHARAESVALDEKWQEFDAVELMNQCLDVADGLAMEKNVTIIRSVPEKLKIRSKPQRLRGIMMNLLGNAIAYNHPGGTVELRLEADGAELELKVIDTGRGIAAEHLPHIFEPFYRAHDPSRSEDSAEAQHHMGLGLALVASHVKALGGKCGIESIVGAGTTMSILLPDVVVGEPANLEGAAV
jgi:two-component system heavy metal sensor histidine kinase CusS